ncbi:hypothetical protein kam1_125 [Methylacidiphilum kamchatkense Kam1]|uniref:Opacity protein-like surface antigen n=1 Tax=Methylacidiphilum kamchatkense Kam1 TaxID=1202785 RepID=A0A516TJN8_9BACT|nr:hypothetical protein kam1_125 [Methylacidiphilum kamchatkense Kam1]
MFVSSEAQTSGAVTSILRPKRYPDTCSGGFRREVSLPTSTSNSWSADTLSLATHNLSLFATSLESFHPDSIHRCILTFTVFLISTLLSTPQTLLCQEQEEDGVAVQQQVIDHALLPSLFSKNPSKPPQEPPGNWFLTFGAGSAFPEFDRGEIVNNLTGAVTPMKFNADFAFTSLFSAGFRWFDLRRWGHWSFDVGFLGAYLGTGTSALLQRDQTNLGFLGLGGSVGYRIGQDRFEPFVGFAGGGAIVNVESTSVNLGEVWGYWFAPRGGIRYYLPGTRWSIGIEGIFRFVGALNGFKGPSAESTFNETPHAGLEGHWLYVPLVLFEIGYRF